MREDLSTLRIERNRRPDGSGGAGRFWMAVAGVLFLALTGLAYYTLWRAPQASQPSIVAVAGDRPEPSPTRAEPPGREVLIASGYVVAHHKHELGSKVMGRVEWIGVEKGDFVRRGQLLVKLEDREFRAQLRQAEATLSLARERLAELEAGSRRQEIERAGAEARRAEAEVDIARLEYDRLESLLQAGVVAPQDVDNARARYNMAAATLDSARRSHELFEEGPRLERIRQARAEVEQAEAAVDYAQTMLDATEIRAPITGTVLRRIAEVGEMITTSFAGEGGAKSAVVALADLNDLQVELDISQTDFNRISSEQECVMSPEAFPERVYPCAIYEIAPEANRQKASIQVKVKVLDPDDYLRPEMSARVTFFEREDDSHE
jgi:HlyD family secretion protein